MHPSHASKYRDHTPLMTRVRAPNPVPRVPRLAPPPTPPVARGSTPATADTTRSGACCRRRSRRSRRRCGGRRSRGGRARRRWRSRCGTSAGSKANGSLMRCVPLGVSGWSLGYDALVACAREDSSLTHPNPACISNLASRNRTPMSSATRRRVPPTASAGCRRSTSCRGSLHA